MKQCSSAPGQRPRGFKAQRHYMGHLFEKLDSSAQLQCHYCKETVRAAELTAMDVAEKARVVRARKDEKKSIAECEREFVQNWCNENGHVLVPLESYAELQNEVQSLRLDVERARVEKVILGAK